MVIPNEGLLLWALWAFNDSGAAQEDFVVDLYTNDYTPVFTSSGSNFAIATFAGYVQFALARNTFTSITATSGVATVVSTAAPNWTGSTGANQTVYGWVMRGASSGKVLAAQLFPSAPTVVPGLNVSLGPMTFDMGQFS